MSWFQRTKTDRAAPERRGSVWPRLSTASLAAQLLVSTAVPMITLLLALAVVSAYAFTRLTQTLIEQRDAELVQLATQQVTAHVSDSVLLLAQLASANEVRQGDLSAITALLEANVALKQRFDAISVTDVQGSVIATTGGMLGEGVGSHGYFERTRRLRRPVRSPVYEDALGQQVIVVTVPVYDSLSRFAGCVLGVWRLRGNALGLPVRALRVGERGIAYLVDESGRILYHPATDLIGADAHGHPAVAALLKGEVGAQTVRDHGVTTVVGYAPMALHERGGSLLADETWAGWGLLTAEYWADIIAPLQAYSILMLGLLALVVLLPVIILAVNSRRITAPVQSLVTQVERVASGEFDTQVSIAAGPSEVRNLEIAFNKMVEQLRRYQADLQRYIVAILNSQEQERKRVARELHDETAQALVVLGRRIEVAQELATTPEGYAQLEEVRDLVDGALQGVRRFTSDLRPPLLEELGLKRTIEILGSRTAREESIEIEVRIVGEPRPLPPELELGLYRLAQEGLSNVRRHAGATHVDLTLTYGEEAVKLEIVDNGVGFEMPTDPVELVHLGQLGLMGMQERARLFGGRAVIRSQPGEGAAITVLIPFAGNALRSLASANTTSAAPSEGP
jgi:two-component system sensor histidine kinase UhpB